MNYSMRTTQHFTFFQALSLLSDFFLEVVLVVVVVAAAVVVVNYDVCFVLVSL
jgi:hypothetical protein